MRPQRADLAGRSARRVQEYKRTLRLARRAIVEFIYIMESATIIQGRLSC